MDIFEKLRLKKEQMAATEQQATQHQTAYQAAKPPTAPSVPKLTLPGVQTLRAPPERVAEPVKFTMGNLDAAPEATDLSEEEQDALLSDLSMDIDLDDDDDDDEDSEEYEAAEQDPEPATAPPAPPAPRPVIRGLGAPPATTPAAPAAKPALSGLAPLKPKPAPVPSDPGPVTPDPAPAAPPASAPAAKPALSLPAGSMLARMAARNTEQKAAETAGLEAFDKGLSLPARPGLSPAGALAAAAAAPRSYSPEEYRDDWDALPELVGDADGQDKDEYNRERMLLIAKASRRIEEIFGGEMQGLAVTAASEMSIAEVSQLVKLTFIRVKSAPGAWAMLDLQDKARVIAGMKAMAVKRNSSVKSRKPKEAAALSGSLEVMGSGLSEEDLADLDSSGFGMSFGDFGL